VLLILYLDSLLLTDNSQDGIDLTTTCLGYICTIGSSGPFKNVLTGSLGESLDIYLNPPDFAKHEAGKHLLQLTPMRELPI